MSSAGVGRRRAASSPPTAPRTIRPLGRRCGLRAGASRGGRNGRADPSTSWRACWPTRVIGGDHTAHRRAADRRSPPGARGAVTGPARAATGVHHLSLHGLAPAAAGCGHNARAAVDPSPGQRSGRREPGVSPSRPRIARLRAPLPGSPADPRMSPESSSDWHATPPPTVESRSTARFASARGRRAAQSPTVS